MDLREPPTLPRKPAANLEVSLPQFCPADRTTVSMRLQPELVQVREQRQLSLRRSKFEQFFKNVSLYRHVFLSVLEFYD